MNGEMQLLIGELVHGRRLNHGRINPVSDARSPRCKKIIHPEPVLARPRPLLSLRPITGYDGVAGLSTDVLAVPSSSGTPPKRPIVPLRLIHDAA